MDDLPLGKHVTAPESYDPSVLRRLDRAPSRHRMGVLAKTLPFVGEDVWRCYELTWLQRSHPPGSGVLTLRVPCDSEWMVESKSLKLYLNSFAQTLFAGVDEVASAIRTDVSKLLETEVAVSVRPPRDFAAFGDFGGFCLDQMAVAVGPYRPDPGALTRTGEDGEDAVHTHLFRTLCPVTGQPDLGSIAIEWRGQLLDRVGLLRYLISFRQEESFHEEGVERIYMEVSRATAATELTVDARFLRRGGIDINPFRSTHNATAPALRLHRQ